MADKKPSNGFIVDAFEDLLEGIGDVADGSIFDFGEEAPEVSTKEVSKDGNGSGSAGGVSKDESGGVKRDESTGKFKSVAAKLGDAFSAPKEKGKATGLAGKAEGETGSDSESGKDE